MYHTRNKFGKYGIDWYPKLLSIVLVIAIPLDNKSVRVFTYEKGCSIYCTIQYVEGEKKNKFFDLLEEAPALPCLVA